MHTECIAQRSKNQNLTGKLVIQQLILPSDLKWQSARPDIVILLFIVIWNISEEKKLVIKLGLGKAVCTKPEGRYQVRSVETHT